MPITSPKILALGDELTEKGSSPEAYRYVVVSSLEGSLVTFSPTNLEAPERQEYYEDVWSSDLVWQRSGKGTEMRHFVRNPFDYRPFLQECNACGEDRCVVMRAVYEEPKNGKGYVTVEGRCEVTGQFFSVRKSLKWVEDGRAPEPRMYHYYVRPGKTEGQGSKVQVTGAKRAKSGAPTQSEVNIHSVAMKEFNERVRKGEPLVAQDYIEIVKRLQGKGRGNE